MTKKVENLNTPLQPSLDIAGVSSRACKFAEWLQENRWFSFYDGKWSYTFQQGTAMSRKTYERNYMKTTEELYVMFCNEHGY